MSELCLETVEPLLCSLGCEAFPAPLSVYKCIRMLFSYPGNKVLKLEAYPKILEIHTCDPQLDAAFLWVLRLLLQNQKILYIKHSIIIILLYNAIQ